MKPSEALNARVRSLVVSASIVSLPLTCAFAQSDASATAAPAPYLRVVDDQAAKVVRLEVAARRFNHSEEGWPEVRMAGAVHIGDAHFYEALQNLMDAQDVVLFESVKPSGMGEIPADATDEHRARITERRVRLLGMFIERQVRQSGELPASIAEVETSMDERFAKILAGASEDAWDRPITYTTNEDGDRFTLTSNGADGQPGGEGADADIVVETPRPSPGEEKEGSGGIQKQLASSLGLVFQPEAMNEGGPNWRNSDMSVDQVQERMDAAGVDAAPLFNMLSGESFAAKFAGLMLKLVTASETSRAMTKLMMVEMLGSADQLLEAGAGGMGVGNAAGFMKVLIDDRNAVVMADLERIVRTEPDVRTVGILYGAGHLGDMESRLVELGYTPVEDEWFPAITVDLAASNLSIEQADAMRRMMRTSIERQMKAAQRGR